MPNMMVFLCVVFLFLCDTISVELRLSPKFAGMFLDSVCRTLSFKEGWKCSCSFKPLKKKILMCSWPQSVLSRIKTLLSLGIFCLSPYMLSMTSWVASEREDTLRKWSVMQVNEAIYNAASIEARWETSVLAKGQWRMHSVMVEGRQNIWNPGV